MIPTKIAGTTFCKSESLLRKLKPGDILLLQREHDNPKDPNAILILNQEGITLGYVTAKVAAQITPAMDAGVAFTATVKEVTGGDAIRESVGCNIEITKSGDFR